MLLNSIQKSSYHQTPINICNKSTKKHFNGVFVQKRTMLSGVCKHITSHLTKTSAVASSAVTTQETYRGMATFSYYPNKNTVEKAIPQHREQVSNLVEETANHPLAGEPKENGYIAIYGNISHGHTIPNSSIKGTNIQKDGNPESKYFHTLKNGKTVNVKGELLIKKEIIAEDGSAAEKAINQAIERAKKLANYENF